jgi:hypothetical protein
VTVTDPGAQSGTEGAAVSLQMQATTTTGGALTFTATGLPAGLQISSGGLISGTPAAGSAGDSLVTVTATDGTYSASQTFDWSIAPAVAITDPGPQSNTEGDVVNLQLQATDAAGGTLAYSATGLPAGLGVSANGKITGTVAAGAAGFYDATITATDGTFSASQSVDWDVAPLPAGTWSGDTAALDAYFAALTPAGQINFDDLVYQPGQNTPTFSDLVYQPGRNGGDNPVPVAFGHPGLGLLAGQILGATPPTTPDFSFSSEHEQDLAAWWANLPEARRQELTRQLQAVQGPRTVTYAPSMGGAGQPVTVTESVAEQRQQILVKAWWADGAPEIARPAPAPAPARPRTRGPAAPPPPALPPSGPSQPGTGLGLMSKEEYDTWMFILDNAFLEANARANLLTAAKYALDDLPEAIRAKVAEFLTPQAIELYIGTLVLVAEAQAMGPEVAATVDTVLAGVTYAWLGSETLSVVCDVGRYLFNAVYAESDDDLQLAGAYLARAVATIVGDTGFVLATKAASKISATFKLSMTYKLAVDPEAAAVPKTPADLNAKVAELKTDMANEGHTAGQEVLLDPALGKTRCFAAGTPLRTPEGEKPVEQFRPDDLILARPEHAPFGPVEARRVQQVFVRVSPLLQLQVCGRLIPTTAEHPFHIFGGGWTAAAFLRPGDALVTEDGRPVLVESVVETREVATVYNVQVEEHHTYFVGAREWGFAVWAHNAEYAVGQNAAGQWTVEYNGKVVETTATEAEAQAQADKFNEAAEAARQLKAADAAKEARLKETAARNKARREAAEAARRVPNPNGRNGTPAHQADVEANNSQPTGNLRPEPVGNRVPDGVGRTGQVVTIRGQTIDPGPNGRVIEESENFRNGRPVSEGRRQIRDIRAADPNATIVVTDPNNPAAPPLIYPPGTQPPPGGWLPRNTPPSVPYP